MARRSTCSRVIRRGRIEDARARWACTYPLLERAGDVVRRARVRPGVLWQVVQRRLVAVQRIDAVDPPIAPIGDDAVSARRGGSGAAGKPCNRDHEDREQRAAP